jgi:hypothetical protein
MSLRRKPGMGGRPARETVERDQSVGGGCAWGASEFVDIQMSRNYNGRILREDYQPDGAAAIGKGFRLAALPSFATGVGPIGAFGSPQRWLCSSFFDVPQKSPLAAECLSGTSPDAAPTIAGSGLWRLVTGSAGRTTACARCDAAVAAGKPADAAATRSARACGLEEEPVGSASPRASLLRRSCRRRSVSIASNQARSTRTMCWLRPFGEALRRVFARSDDIERANESVLIHNVFSGDSDTLKPGLIEGTRQEAFEAGEFELGDGHLLDKVGFGGSGRLPFMVEVHAKLVKLPGIFVIEDGFLGTQAVSDGIHGDCGFTFERARARGGQGVSAVGLSFLFGGHVGILDFRLAEERVPTNHAVRVKLCNGQRLSWLRTEK